MRFWPTRAMKPGTSTLAGQALWQGARTSPGQTPAAQRFSRMWASYSARKWRMVESTGLGAVWPSPQREVSRMMRPSSSSFTMSPSSPFPVQMRSTISNMRRVPMRQGGHLPQDSSCTKSRKKRAMSTMQVSSSMTMRPPEPMMAPSSCRAS